MKRNVLLWYILTTLILFFPMYLFSQDSFTEKSNVEIKAGECKIIKSLFTKDGKTISKVFEIDVPFDGNYFIELVNSPMSGLKQSVKLFVNKSVIPEIIFPAVIDDKEWQIIKTNENKTTELKKGTNQIKITYENEYAPLIDALSIYRSDRTLSIDNSSQLKYINDLKLKKLPDNYSESKKKTKSGARTLSNPKGNYSHEVDISFNYTHYESFYFNQGQNVVLETKNTNTDPVMYLFNANPNNGSWVSDDWDGVTLNSKINITIPQSGWYVLMVRAYQSQSLGINAGTCDLWKDGVVFRTSIPVAGTFYGVPSKGNTAVNFFSTKLSSGGDTRIYIATGQVTGIVAENDDYPANSNSAWAWGVASRIKMFWSTSLYNSSVSSIFLSSFGISSSGTCDLYMNCENSTIYTNSAFPNLKSDDAIQTAPQTGGSNVSGAYNCASWAGGISTFWFWPSAFSSWSNGNNYLASFDSFYGNTPARYAGAWTYTRTNATATNSAVALGLIQI